MDQDDRLHVEACSNARALARICDLLGVGVPIDTGRDPKILGELRSSIYAERADLMRDYDPDVDGWPWETSHL